MSHQKATAGKRSKVADPLDKSCTMYVCQVDGITGVSQLFQGWNPRYSMVVSNFPLQPENGKDGKEIERPGKTNGCVEGEHGGDNACCPDARSPAPYPARRHKAHLKQLQSLGHMHTKQPTRQAQGPVQPRTIGRVYLGSRICEYGEKRDRESQGQQGPPSEPVAQPQQYGIDEVVDLLAQQTPKNGVAEDSEF